MLFKDHFSRQAADYIRFRPDYPSALFAFLASLTARRDAAWDCATGSGQAAHGLAAHFERVIASDASAKQIANARVHPRITYVVAAAENTPIARAAIDLVTVSQALHWFDLDAFYAEASRVLRTGAIIAVWCYQLLRISPRIDAVLDRLYSDVVGRYWPPERNMIDDGYRSIPFPFHEFAAPQFKMDASWDLQHLLGYLGTWSAVQRFRSIEGRDPVEVVSRDLEEAWGAPQSARRITWPLRLRVGKP